MPTPTVPFLTCDDLSARCAHHEQIGPYLITFEGWTSGMDNDWLVARWHARPTYQTAGEVPLPFLVVGINSRVYGTYLPGATFRMDPWPGWAPFTQATAQTLDGLLDLRQATILAQADLYSLIHQALNHQLLPKNGSVAADRAIDYLALGED